MFGLDPYQKKKRKAKLHLVYYCLNEPRRQFTSRGDTNMGQRDETKKKRKCYISFLRKFKKRSIVSYRVQNRPLPRSWRSLRSFLCRNYIIFEAPAAPLSLISFYRRKNSLSLKILLRSSFVI